MLTEDTVFKHRERLADLPRGAELRIAVDADAYALTRRADAALGPGRERLYAEVRPNLLLELADRRLFDEAAWQLARPLNRASIRVLSLDPAGPKTLAAAPKIDPATKRALSDPIDPASLPAALSGIRGQTAIVTGRIERDTLVFRQGSGDAAIRLPDLMAAAERADVNLVILQSATPRQPGTRNWLWQRVSVDGLDGALQRASLADFLNALGAGQSKLMVTAADAGAGPRVAESGADARREHDIVRHRRRVHRHRLGRRRQGRHDRRRGQHALVRAPAGTRPPAGAVAAR